MMNRLVEDRGRARVTVDLSDGTVFEFTADGITIEREVSQIDVTPIGDSYSSFVDGLSSMTMTARISEGIEVSRETSTTGGHYTVQQDGSIVEEEEGSSVGEPDETTAFSRLKRNLDV